MQRIPPVLYPFSCATPKKYREGIAIAIRRIRIYPYPRKTWRADATLVAYNKYFDRVDGELGGCCGGGGGRKGGQGRIGKTVERVHTGGRGHGGRRRRTRLGGIRSILSEYDGSTLHTLPRVSGV